jgi:hypothetical protein
LFSIAAIFFAVRSRSSSIASVVRICFLYQYSEVNLGRSL